MKRLIALLVTFIYALTALGGGSTPAPAAATSKPLAAAGAAGPSLLQFTSAGQILGIQADGIYIAGRDHALHVSFAGANPVQPAAAGAAAAGTPEGGEANPGAAPSLGVVTWTNLWDGISLTAAAAPGSIYETTYALAPGAAVESIRLRYNTPVRLSEDGSLDIQFGGGAMRESAPVAWQESGSGRIPVTAAFTLSPGGEVGFALGAHNPALALTIDPRLEWVRAISSGSGPVADYAQSLILDSAGNLLVSGYSYRPWDIGGKPIRRPFTQPVSGYGIDVFVAKLNSAGITQWMTFLGGDDDDQFGGLALDGTGNIYVCGVSYATWGSPVQAIHGVPDAFVARLNPDGTLSANTFVGGANIDYGFGLVYSSGSLMLSGMSQDSWGSPVRPFTSNGLNRDGFIAKLSPSTLALSWNTFVGGTGDDGLNGLVVDSGGNSVITGSSSAAWGSPIRAFNTADAYVAKVDGSGNLLWNTFLGGAGADGGMAIALDSGNGSVYITGYSDQTWSLTGISPARPYTGSNDAFVVELSYSGVPYWYTFLGSSAGFDTGFALTLSGSSVFVTGYSNATWGSPLNAYSSSYDCFIAALERNTGALQWSTFAGGAGMDQGKAITVDASSPANLGVYVLGESGMGWGNPGRAYAGGSDAFVLKLTSASGWAPQWNTFLGAGQDDYATGLAIDPATGSIYVSGTANESWNAYSRRKYTWLSDAFVQAFQPNGWPDWTTYLGGNGDDTGTSLVFANNHLYVAGDSSATWGSPKAAFSTGPDAFVAALDSATGDLLWNTFAGGAGSDMITALTVRDNGQIYAGGYSSATWGGPTVSYSGGYDGFAFLLNADGSRMWNTFLGGAGSDAVYDIAIHGTLLYAVGSSSESWGFPITEPFHGVLSDAFAVKINPDTGNYGATGWVAFLGGNGWDAAYAVTTNSFGYLYVGGASGASWGTPRRSFSAGSDGFVAYLSSSGSLQFNTFLGGSGNDRVSGVILDAGGTPYVTGTSDAAWGSPLTPFHSGNDVFVSRLTWDGYLVWNTFQGGPGADNSSRIGAFGSLSAGTERLYTTSTTDTPWVSNAFNWYKNGADGVLASLNPRAFIFMPAIKK